MVKKRRDWETFGKNPTFEDNFADEAGRARHCFDSDYDSPNGRN